MLEKNIINRGHVETVSSFHTIYSDRNQCIDCVQVDDEKAGKAMTKP